MIQSLLEQNETMTDIIFGLEKLQEDIALYVYKNQLDISFYSLDGIDTISL
ncbi:MAG TPA: hypothetical protein IAB62_02475 [Candidatus Coprocola pullicola]|nr:hypothetical protein [Candidatus Coprocola pullicola]